MWAPYPGASGERRARQAADSRLMAAIKSPQGTVSAMLGARSLLHAASAAMLAAAVFGAASGVPALAETGSTDTDALQWSDATAPSPEALRWQVATSAQPQEVLLLDGSGHQIPWAAVPTAVHGGLELHPPVLSTGTFTITVPGATLPVMLPGLDLPKSIAPAAAKAASATDATNVVTIGAAALLLTGLIAGALLVRRRRRVGVAVMAAGATAASVVIAIGLLSTSGTAATTPLAASLDGRQMAGLYAACEDGTQNSVPRDCWDTASIRIANSGGVPALRTALDAVANSPQQYCHEIAHSLGQAAWFVDRSAAAVVAGGADPRCQQGFAHGAMVSAAQSLPIDRLVAEVDVLCGALGNDSFSETRYAFCVHGAGHALMRRTGGDLQAALLACAHWKGKAGDSCRSAAGMEWNRLWGNASNGGAAPAGYTDPREACAATGISDPDELASCYGSAGSVLKSPDPVSMTRWCTQHPAGQVDACFTGLSGAFGQYTSDLAKIDTWCRQLDGTHADSCLTYNTYLLMVRQRDAGESVCAPLDESRQEPCRAGVRRWLKEADANSEFVLNGA